MGNVNTGALGGEIDADTDNVYDKYKEEYGDKKSSCRKGQNVSSSSVPDPFVTATKEDKRKVTEQGECCEQQYVYATSSMKGLRPRMEDAHIISTSLPIHGSEPLRDHSIFCVFDGHGGDFTSTYLEESMLDTLSRRKELLSYAQLPKVGRNSRVDVTGVQLLKKAIIKSFSEIDSSLLPEQRKRNRDLFRDKNGTSCEAQLAQLKAKLHSCKGEKRKSRTELLATASALISSMERSGSTAVVVILTPSHIVCANVGDSRAILRRASTAIPLSFDHKPSNLPERIRIEQAGGFVKGKRIDGDLAVSRAFGDFVHKDNITLSCAKQKVISVPDVSICPRDKKHDEFIILACDGIWDVFSNDEIANFVHNAMAVSPSPKDLATICEAAIDESFHQRRSRDNMTFMIIGFNNALQSIATHSSSSFFPFQSFTGGLYNNNNKSAENTVSSNDDKLSSSWLQSISSPFDGENKRLLTWF